MKTRMDPYYAEIYNLISINDQMLGIMNSNILNILQKYPPSIY